MARIILQRIFLVQFIFRDFDSAKSDSQTSFNEASIRALDAVAYCNKHYSGELLYGSARENKDRILLSLEEACYTGDPISILHNDF
jgi:hypothetical protein